MNANYLACNLTVHKGYFDLYSWLLCSGSIFPTILNTRSVSALECGNERKHLKKFGRFGNLSAPLAVFISMFCQYSRS